MLLAAAWFGRRPKRRRLALVLFAPLLLWSIGGAVLVAIQRWTKIAYRWQDTRYGKAALERGQTISIIEHARVQLNRLSTPQAKYDESRWERDFLQLLNSYMRFYLKPRRGETDEAHHARMQIGLAKLDRIIAAFVKQVG